MSEVNFADCLKETLKHEGGFVQHPRDPGGATNLGITHRTLAAARGRPVTVQDVRTLSRTEAGHIYRVRYWDASSCGQMPDGLDLVLFDGAVNSGPSRGAKWLQSAIGATVDGAVGPQTIARASAVPTGAAIEKACSARMGFLRRLRHWDTFGRGWSRRVASIEAEATRMHLAATGAQAAQVRTQAVRAVSAAQHNATAATRAGAAQVTGVGAGVGAVGQAEAIPSELIVWIIAAVVIVGVIAVVRAKMRRDHQIDRAEMFRKLERVA